MENYQAAMNLDQEEEDAPTEEMEEAPTKEFPAPAGYYPDPFAYINQGLARYWNGREWTSDCRGLRSVDANHQLKPYIPEGRPERVGSAIGNTLAFCALCLALPVILVCCLVGLIIDFDTSY